MRPTPSQETTFGYLSALRTAEHGFLGGYLIVTPLGRPLEFHCTAPTRPSRAQEILYGPTLQQYLLGEQIGRTLLDKAERTPKVVLTDQPAVLCLRSQTPLLIVHLLGDPPAVASLDLTTEGGSCPDREVDGRCFGLHGYCLALPDGFETDRDSVTQLLTTLSHHVELSEPFGRIQEAIREALRLGTPGLDAHGQAA